MKKGKNIVRGLLPLFSHSGHSWNTHTHPPINDWWPTTTKTMFDNDIKYNLWHYDDDDKANRFIIIIIIIIKQQIGRIQTKKWIFIFFSLAHQFVWSEKILAKFPKLPFINFFLYLFSSTSLSLPFIEYSIQL